MTASLSIACHNILQEAERYMMLSEIALHEGYGQEAVEKQRLKLFSAIQKFQKLRVRGKKIKIEPID